MLALYLFYLTAFPKVVPSFLIDDKFELSKIIKGVQFPGLGVILLVYEIYFRRSVFENLAAGEERKFEILDFNLLVGS